jgi:5-methyltetrahydropteroyltriglutamate--homocysteine methyltransferase
LSFLLEKPAMSHRILTTHVGSLPRPERVVTQLFAQDSGLNYAEVDFDTIMAAEVAEVVARQATSRVDVVSDGEMSKISYATYIKDRLTGFDGDSIRNPPADLEDYPNFLKILKNR